MVGDIWALPGVMTTRDRPTHRREFTHACESVRSVNPKDLFARDEHGRTALIVAAAEGREQEVSRIIFSLAGTGFSPSRLALLSIEDNDGLTAADVAERAGHSAIADLLRGEQARMEFFE